MDYFVFLFSSYIYVSKATWIQILNKAVCISHSINTLGKSMHPNILSPTMSK